MIDMLTRRMGCAALVLAPVVALAACTSGSAGAPQALRTPVAAPSTSTASRGAATPSVRSAAPTPARGTHRPAGTGGPPAGHRSGRPAPYPTPGTGPAALKDQTSVLDALPGNASGACAVVGNRRDVRSGGVAAGNFAAARRSFAKQYRKTEVPEMNMYVIPRTAVGNHRVRVMIDPLGRGPTTTAASTQVEQADAARYFALMLPIERPGTYRLTMRSAGGSGCFNVSFSA
ncbi:MAG TPA: hypothetical protein VFH38_03675 [Jatrophihabitans sp.]|nr:hypothetical protein [Jatrophihabitans sp.]